MTDTVDIAALRRAWNEAEDAYNSAYSAALLKHRGEGSDKIIEALAFQDTVEERRAYYDAALKFNAVVDEANLVIADAYRAQHR